MVTFNIYKTINASNNEKFCAAGTVRPFDFRFLFARFCKTLAFTRFMLYNEYMKKYSTFIFDLYNTLINIRTDESSEKAWNIVRAEMAARSVSFDGNLLAAVNADFETQIKRAHAEGVVYPEIDWVEALCNLFGGKITTTEAEELFKKYRAATCIYMYPFPDAAKTLETLKNIGAQVYLLSNAQSCVTKDEFAQSGLDKYFDGVMFSSDEKIAKPSAEFFDRLFKKYDIDKKSAIMVGDDKRNDMDGARAYGIARFRVKKGVNGKRAEKLIRLAKSV